MSLTDKFDQHKKRKLGKISPQKPSEESEVENENFVKPGHIRNLAFVLADGQKQFFNYSDLTNGIFTPEENTLVLNFRGIAAITLKGSRLDLLYDKLLHQIPQKIACKEKRYEATKLEDEIYVEEITITETQV
ncbi:hypothetical protein [Flavobacterium sp.]|uniref:hypothetical protein n=1 Tax=Flavobacterium sp. TaxID=239 RepID=UPI0039E54A62